MSIIAFWGGITCFVGLVWFFVRGFRDFAFPDVILFVTGISVIAYAFTRWDRAKNPLLIALGGFVVALVAAELSPIEQQAIQDITDSLE